MQSCIRNMQGLASLPLVFNEVQPLVVGTSYVRLIIHHRPPTLSTVVKLLARISYITTLSNMLAQAWRKCAALWSSAGFAQVMQYLPD